MATGSAGGSAACTTGAAGGGRGRKERDVLLVEEDHVIRADRRLLDGDGAFGTGSDEAPEGT